MSEWGHESRGAGRSFKVAGVAVTAATPPYPEPACLANLCQGGDTGVVWLTQADAVASIRRATLSTS